MATTFMTVCTCGTKLQVYVPKAQLAEWLPAVYGDDPPEELAELDAEEQASPEIPAAKYLARLMDAGFVDYREHQTCPYCGAELGLWEAIQAKKGGQ